MTDFHFIVPDQPARLDQPPKLVTFIDHGQVEIDTNLTENAIRPTAVGKKNWLFLGGEANGQTSAVI